MKKNYTADFGLIKISDDMDRTIEVTIGSERYIAHKPTIDSCCNYSCMRMDDVEHNNLNISEETDCYPKNKLDAINMILRYAGTYTYQTLVKKGNVA